MTSTQEKVLNTVYQKLCAAFEIEFIPRKKFEKEFLANSDYLLGAIPQLIESYYELKSNGDNEIIILTKDEYILKRFNSSYYSSKEYNRENLSELKIKEERRYNEYILDYEKELNTENNEIVSLSLFEFLKKRIQEIISVEDNANDLPVKKIFWNYFKETHLSYSYLSRYDRNNKDYSQIVEMFKQQYLDSKYIKLFDKVEQEVLDTDFSGFDSPIINVGVRDYVIERSGWTTNRFLVVSNGKKYRFTYSSKDEKAIEGEFVNIFITQFQKKRLLKISVTLEGTDQTYLSDRDFEKVSLKDDSEILITKHHGNETIIFETRHDAKRFQDQVIDMRQRRGR